MTTKGRALILVSLAIVGIVFALIAHAQTSDDSDKAAVIALNQAIIAAYNHADAHAIAAYYSDDPVAIFFEDAIPFQLNKAQLTKLNEDTFKSLSNFHATTEAVDVVTGGDLAALHCIIRGSWTDKNGKHSQVSRYTQVDRKEGGKWLVWNEHFSVPFDPATGKAVLDARP
jgi:uncharacterized protein (TIGR02246 family)